METVTPGIGTPLLSVTVPLMRLSGSFSSDRMGIFSIHFFVLEKAAEEVPAKMTIASPAMYINCFPVCLLTR